MAKDGDEMQKKKEKQSGANTCCFWWRYRILFFFVLAILVALAMFRPFQPTLIGAGYWWEPRINNKKLFRKELRNILSQNGEFHFSLPGLVIVRRKLAIDKNQCSKYTARALRTLAGRKPLTLEELKEHIARIMPEQTTDKDVENQ